MTAPPNRPEPADSGAPLDGQIACSMASTLLRCTRATLGDNGVQDILRRADVAYSPDFLEDVGNWLWYHEAVALFEAAEEVLGDPHIGRRVGEDAVRQHAGTPVATLRSLGSPEAIFEQVTQAVAKFSTVTEMHSSRWSPAERSSVPVRGRL